MFNTFQFHLNMKLKQGQVKHGTGQKELDKKKINKNKDMVQYLTFLDHKIMQLENRKKEHNN